MSLKLPKSDIVRNFEILRGSASIYTFASQNEVIDFLSKEAIPYSNLTEVPMTFEDAFIGITGKY